MLRVVAALSILLVVSRHGRADVVLTTSFAGWSVPVIDVDGDSLVEEIAGADSSQFIDWDQARRWAFTSNHDGTIGVVDIDARVCTSIAVAGVGRPLRGLCYDSTRRRLYCTTAGTDGFEDPTDPLDVVAVSGDTFPPTLSYVTSIPLGRRPIRPFLNRTGDVLVVTVRNEQRVVFIDVSADTVLAVYDFPSGPTFDPEGGDCHPTQDIAYVLTHGTSTLEVFDLATYSVVAHLSLTHLGPGPVQPSTGIVAPDGVRMFVSGQTCGKVLELDISDPLNPVQTGVELPVGPQPHGIVFLPGDRAYILNTNNNQPLGSITIISVGATPQVLGTVLGTFRGPVHGIFVPDASSAPSDSRPIVPESVALSAVPNPFNAATTFSFDLPEGSRVRLDVFDVLGRRVASLVDSYLPAGRHSAVWDASEAASGAYVVRVACDAGSAMSRVMLVK